VDESIADVIRRVMQVVGQGHVRVLNLLPYIDDCITNSFMQREWLVKCSLIGEDPFFQNRRLSMSELEILRKELGSSWSVERAFIGSIHYVMLTYLQHPGDELSTPQLMEKLVSQARERGVGLRRHLADLYALGEQQAQTVVSKSKAAPAKKTRRKKARGSRKGGKD
jgi:hypothetical protein